MRVLRFAAASALALVVLVPPATAADAPPVDEIVARTNEAAYYRGLDGRARVKMTITDAQGRERTRAFTILRRDQDQAEGARGGEQRFYVYFSRPADVNKMAFMVWKHVGADDDRWLYLPALDLVKRIAAADKRTSFVGSDFFYEDVSGRATTEDTHALSKTTETYYVLDNTPKAAGSVEFARYEMWIHRTTFLPVKIDYYDAAGAKYREYQALKVDTVQGHPTVTKAQMKDLRTGSTTVLEYEDVRYDLGLPEDIFTERYLRTPPREFLR